MTSSSPNSNGGQARSSERLLRLRDVAVRCDVALRTVQQWVAAGRLRVLRFGSRCTRVDPVELERFLRDAADEGARS